LKYLKTKRRSERGRITMGINQVNHVESQIFALFTLENLAMNYYNSEGRRQKAEGRRQKAEGRRLNTIL
jgi:hypothetical protein